MNKLILIKTNVNMKQIESIKVGVGGEILSAEVKTIKTVSAEQFCQIYLRDTIKIKTNLAAGTIRNTITSLVKKKMLFKDSKYKAVYYLNPEYFFKGKISDRTQIIKNIIEYKFI